MGRHILHAITWGLVAGLALTGCTDSATEGSSPEQRRLIRFGILPAVGDQTLRQDYEVFVQRMSATLARPVKLVVAQQYDDLPKALADGMVEAAVLSPYLYLRAKRNTVLEVLAQTKGASEVPYRGVIVVPKDSPLKTLADLSGKTLGYVDPHSSAGYFFARIAMRRAKLDPATALGTTTFLGSHGAVVEAVTSGKVDAGAISITAHRDHPELRVLAETPPIPEDVIVTTDRLTSDERQGLTAWLLHAHKDPQLAPFLAQRRIAKYVAHDPGDYSVLDLEVTLTHDVETAEEPETPPEDAPGESEDVAPPEAP